ncbi:restriction endonuclease [Paraburkholderia tropica]|uniref:restriction endonuclease n=1 Tax=Paraburkholderia tropica TaxID=92647 RepID=UPI002AB6384B|nr:restriction endonuclease [Paraburkholderia tropica]
MPENTERDWVLPTEIPFSELKGKDLEECVYWLLDAMGAKDLEWRIGGAGGGAADGGRDLEAHFFEPDEEGELRPQRWWVECKGRSGTVESQEVKEACNNALAYEGIDRLIIATNTQFSNPTRDWVKEWQRTFSRPRVQLWDRAHLERYLSRHP